LWARLFKAEGAIKLTLQSELSLVERSMFLRRCQMSQRIDYNAATPAGVKALGGVAAL
jgi:hypothetical protein